MDSEDEGNCEVCARIQELLSKDSDASFTPEDALAFLEFFQGWQEFRDCGCFIGRNKYWNLHRKVRSFFQKLLLPIIAAIPLSKWPMKLIEGNTGNVDPPPSEPSTSHSPPYDENVDSNEFSSEFQFRLVEFSAQMFCENFPLFTMYRKEFGIDPTDSMGHTGFEKQRTSYPLIRMAEWAEGETKVTQALEEVFKRSDNRILPLRIAQLLVHIYSQIRGLSSRNLSVKWEVRQAIISYLLKCAEDTQLIRDRVFRLLAENVWMLRREAQETDVAGLQLALVHLKSTALTPRLSALHQINLALSSLNEALGASSKNGPPEALQLRIQELGELIRGHDVIGMLFGPSTHPELLKQSLPLLSFLCLHGKLAKADMDCIWIAFQKKEYSRQVCDLLCSVIKNMELSLVAHLYEALKALQPSEHSEMTINITFLIVEIFWQVSVCRAPVSTTEEDASSSDEESLPEIISPPKRVPAVEKTSEEAPAAKKARLVSPQKRFKALEIAPSPASSANLSSSSSGSEVADINQGAAEREWEEGERIGAGSPLSCLVDQPEDVMGFLVRHKNIAIPRGPATDSEVSSDRETAVSDRMVEFDGSEEMELGHDKSPPRPVSGRRGIMPKILEAWRGHPIFQCVVSPTASSWRIPLLSALSGSEIPINLTNITQPGSTLLWDLVQLEGENKLGPREEALALDRLLTLLEKFPAEPIRASFIRSCVENLRLRKANMVSLKLLTRVLAMMAQHAVQISEEEKDVLDALANFVEEFQVVSVFLDNLKWYYQEGQRTESHVVELTARFNLVGLIFPSFTEGNSVKALELFDAIWEHAFPDRNGGKVNLCHWLLELFRSRIQDCSLTLHLMRHIIANKLEDFEPESLCGTELALVETMLELGEGKEAELCLPLAWKIFLHNGSSSVSVKAMTSLSSYYIHCPEQEEVAAKEQAFINLCMEHLESACKELESGRSSSRPLTVIHRALLILKSHVDAFRKRYGYYLRSEEIKDPRLKPHQKLAAGSFDGLPCVQVSLQVSGIREKFSLEPMSCETVGELRAEITGWLRSSLKSMNDSRKEVVREIEALSVLPSTIRLFHSGKELKQENDDHVLAKIGVTDNSDILVSFNERRNGGGSITSGGSSREVPLSYDSSPMALLAVPQRWNLLMRAIQLLLQHALLCAEDRSRSLAFAKKAWEVLILLPSSCNYLDRVNSALKNESGWTEFLQKEKKHQLLYALQTVEMTVFQDRVPDFKASKGFAAVLDVFLSKCLLPSSGFWTDWDLSCIVHLLRIVYRMIRMTHNESPSAQRSLDPSLFGADLEQFLRILQETILAVCTESNCSEVSDLKRLQVFKYLSTIQSELMLYQPELCNVFLGYPGFQDWLKQVILLCMDPYLRQEATMWLYRICHPADRKVTWFSKQILQSLLGLLDEAQQLRPLSLEDMQHTKKKGEEYVMKEPVGPSSRSYFWLVVQVVNRLKPEDYSEEELEALSETLNKMERYLSERPSHELKEHGPVDPTLPGLLMLAKALVKLKTEWTSAEVGKRLLETVWILLFALPGPKSKSEPKCKTMDSRAAGFDLLVELARGSVDNYLVLYKRVMLQNKGLEAFPWDYWPEDERRSASGYVGLVNLGATCYLATAVQHLFMIPVMRSAIIAVNYASCTKHTEMMRELQKLFIFLSESERKAYDPRSLCKSYEMDRQPLNTAEQKDMSEFLTDLLSKLEEIDGNLKNVVQELFCGTMSSNVISQDCAHVSQTTENFYNVRCQVAQMKDLYASLNELTVADTLEGDNMYTCSDCNKKVRAKKQACFKELPKILSFNTMRYTFNMITMTKEKVNTHFSFPEELDMTPYMEQSIFAAGSEPPEPASRLYRLIGVTVHSGTAEGGHYYSFIRDPHNQAKWFWFNDAEVREWDAKNLPSECFGGEHPGHQFDSGPERFLDLSFEKANNAYMVFYERVEKPADNSEEQMVASVAETPPNDLEEWIWADNVEFIRNTMLFSHNYFQFVWEVASPGDLSLSLDPQDLADKSAKLSLRFVFQTLIHAKEKPTMANWTENLVKLLNASPKACKWFFDFMATDKRWLVDILIKCPISACRQLLAKLIVHVLIQEGEKEHHLYLKPRTVGGEEEIGSESSVARLIKSLLKILAPLEIDAEIRELNEYLELFISFANGGGEARKFLLRIGCIRTLINFYMRKTVQELSENAGEESDEELGLLSLVKTCVSRSLWLSPAFDRMLQLIIILFQASKDAEGKYCLDPLDLKAIFSPHHGNFFLMQQIKDASNVKTASALIVAVCQLNKNCSERVLDDMFRSIGTSVKEEETSSFYQVLSELATSAETAAEFVPLILERLWKRLCHGEVASVDALRWISRNLPNCPLLHQFLLKKLPLFTERFMLKAHQFQVRYAAGECICCLIPTNIVKSEFIQHHRSPVRVPTCRSDVPSEAVPTLHHVLEFLLGFLPKAEQFGEQSLYGNHRLVLFFNTIRACLISQDEKKMLTPHIKRLWSIYYKYMHPHQERISANKQALFLLWYQASLECPDNVLAAMDHAPIVNNFMLNFIVIDSEKETISFNKAFLTAYYGLARLFCTSSWKFAEIVMEHDNTKFAVCNVAVRSSEYRQANQDILAMLEACCKHPSSTKVREFKKKLWEFLCEIIGNFKSNFPIFLRVLRFLVDGPDDKVYLLQNKVLNTLSDVFFMIHRMYHEVTMCSMIGDMSEILKRLYDFCARAEQLKKAEGMEATAESILNDWSKAKEVGEKLLSLLNSFVPPDIRKQAVSCLMKMVKLLDSEPDFIFSILDFILKAHRHAASRPLGSYQLGPFFPKRGRQETGATKAVPPRPLLEMQFHPMLLEAARGVDPEYDQELLDYFSPYHNLVDTLLRLAINQGPKFGPAYTQLIVDVSTTSGVEAIPLQLPLFPKLWLDVQERSEEKELQPLLEALWKSEGFIAFAFGILTEEQASLNNPVIFHFLLSFIHKVPTDRFSSAKMGTVETNAKETLVAFLKKIDSSQERLISKVLGVLRVVKILRVVKLELSLESELEELGEELKRDSKDEGLEQLLKDYKSLNTESDH